MIHAIPYCLLRLRRGRHSLLQIAVHTTPLPAGEGLGGRASTLMMRGQGVGLLNVISTTSGSILNRNGTKPPNPVDTNRARPAS